MANQKRPKPARSKEKYEETKKLWEELFQNNKTVLTEKSWSTTHDPYAAEEVRQITQVIIGEYLNHDHIILNPPAFCKLITTQAAIKHRKWARSMGVKKLPPDIRNSIQQTTVDDVELENLKADSAIRDFHRSEDAKASLHRIMSACDLTTRQRSLLDCLTQGMSSEEMALVLNTTPEAIRTAVHALRIKLKRRLLED